MTTPAKPDRRTILKCLAETLAIGAIGGIAFGLAGVPAGYLSGSILTVSIAAVAGRSLVVPTSLVRVIFVFIGISLGGMVTPEMLAGIRNYPLSIATLIVAMICVSAAITIYLCFVHRWNKIDAYLASLPGALTQVLALGAELGADLRGVAIVQSIRVVILAIGVPSGLTLLGLAEQAIRPAPPPLTPDVLLELAILIVASTAGAYAALRLRLPGGLMFGAMLTSAALHGSGLIHAIVPYWATNIAAIALGSMIGSRFTNTPLRMILDYLGAALGSFTVSIVIAGAFVAGVLQFMTLRAAEVVISYSPGSIDAMMLLAFALHLDPVFVGAHHIMRVMAVSFSAPLAGRWLAGKPKPPVTPPRDPTSFQD